MRGGITCDHAGDLWGICSTCIVPRAMTSVQQQRKEGLPAVAVAGA